MMSALDVQIEQSRAEIRRLERDGHAAEALLEEQHLRGLLSARILVGGRDVGCVHPVSKTAGVGDDGRTDWRCVHCGQPTRP